MESYVHTFSKRRGEVMFCSEILKKIHVAFLHGFDLAALVTAVLVSAVILSRAYKIYMYLKHQGS